MSFHVDTDRLRESSDSLYSLASKTEAAACRANYIANYCNMLSYTSASSASLRVAGTAISNIASELRNASNNMRALHYSLNTVNAAYEDTERRICGAAPTFCVSVINSSLPNISGEVANAVASPSQPTRASSD